MTLFGWTISLVRRGARKALQTVEASRGWHRIHEAFAGAWQRNYVGDQSTAMSFAAVFRCVALISHDIAKLRIKLVRQAASGIWEETDSSAFSPVLRKPNRYQTRIAFIEQWQCSRLLHGNAYVLLERDQRDVVVAMYVLDPNRVRVMVAPDGSVFYQLGTDNLSGLQQGVDVPASEIIHDTYLAPFHPLVGITPLTACWLAISQGIRLQSQSEAFFTNGAVPSGILTTPQDIDDQQARDIQKRWHEQFSGNNVGKVAVLGLDMKYQPMTMKAIDAQLIEQLRWTGENVCTAFGVPAYMVGIGPPPNYNNIEALNQQYYSQCLQIHIEKNEAGLDEGLGLSPSKIEGVRYGVEFDLDDLLRMDSATMMTVIRDGVNAGILKPNEGRFKLGLPPVEGGDTPYLQQQYWALAKLAERDIEPIPASPSAPQLPAATTVDDEGDQRVFGDRFQKALSALVAAQAQDNAVMVGHVS